jgi:hypothetical protein
MVFHISFWNHRARIQTNKTLKMIKIKRGVEEVVAR